MPETVKESVFTSSLPKRKDHSELRKAVCQVIDLIADGTEFTSLELKDALSKLYPKFSNVFLETIMRYIRYYRRQEIICVSRAQSKYKKIQKETENE